MDERYTNSLIDSIEDYIYKLQYLGTNNKTTLRALNTFKIFHQLYIWADWYEVSENDKIKIEQLINCLILRNSNLVLPTITPGTYYSNVNTPQTLHTWQRVYDDPHLIIHSDPLPEIGN
jgi:hypothetical protein